MQVGEILFGCPIFHVSVRDSELKYFWCREYIISVRC